MLKNFIKGIKEALPAVGGIIGYSVAGPLGAGIGSGIGSLAAGKEADDALRNALIGGAIGYGGQTYFGRDPSRNFLGLGEFFRQGTIPGVSNVITPFGQRGAESTLAKMAGFTAPKAPVGGTQIGIDEYVKNKIAESGASDPDVIDYVREKAIGDFYSQKNKFDISDFFTNNMGYIIPGAIIAQQAGLFDEEEGPTLPQPPEIGSQGALPTGLASLVTPTRRSDGSYFYEMAKDGKLMRENNGLSERQQKFLDMLMEKNKRQMMDEYQNEMFKMQQFQNPRFTPEGIMTIGAAKGAQMNGNINSFQENSPRRDLFLDREGPISDDRGSPNKDTVYAKLADGEFVVNADTVADIGYGMGAKNLDQAKEMGGSFFYGLQDAQKKGILSNNIKGMA